LNVHTTACFFRRDNLNLEQINPLRLSRRCINKKDKMNYIKTVMIGVRLADGSFYPVLDEGAPETKKIILTTAQAGQRRACIAVFRGGPGGENMSLLREFRIDNIGGDYPGDADIELTLSLDSGFKLRGAARIREAAAGDLKPNAVSAAAFVLLGLFILAVFAFLFFRLFRAPPQPPLAAGSLFPLFLPFREKLSAAGKPGL
jgi:hypothetical protein